MDTGALLGFAGVLSTALVTWLVARMKIRWDAKTAKKDRVDALEKILCTC